MSAFFFFTFVLKPKSHELMKTLSQNWVVAALAATWLAAQNVGIGTTTPLTRLHVAAGDIFLGDAAGDNGFVLHSRSSNSYDYLQITTRTTGSYEWSKGITLVRSSGNVGIGTTAPVASLEVRYPGNTQTSYTARFISHPSVAGGGGILFDQGSTYSYKLYTLNTGTTNAVLVLDYINNTDGSLVYEPIIGIRSGGNVGIGTTAPHSAAILQLQATNKGFLPTQVALTSATSWSPLVGTSVDGMLVYNTNTAGTGANAVSPGYYYWRDGRWRRFSENAYAGAIRGVLGSPGQNLTSNCFTYQYLNSYIDLAPGKWIVYSVQILNPSTVSTTGSIWVKTTLSDNSTCSPPHSSYIIGSTLISGLLPHDDMFSLANGQIFINNTSGSVKRYYYCACKESYNGYNANLTNFSTTAWAQNQLYALPAE